MTDEKKQQIIQMYNYFESIEPDISTERLFQQVADACKVEVDDVVEYAIQLLKGE